MAEFNVKIANASWDLTAKERVKYKDTGDAVKLDAVVTKDTPITGFSPVGYVVLDIHNDRATNPDYFNYVIIDQTGKKFVTGSDSFWNSFRNIWDELADLEEDGENYTITIYKKESKNYKGKYFLSCSLE